MRALKSNRDYEKLSAYIDGELSSREKRKLEERIQAHPDLQAALRQLTQTKKLLQMTPHRRAPRNFTLTPAMVSEIKARGKQSSFTHLFPALSFTSALATLALMISFVFQLIPGIQPLMTGKTMADEGSTQPAEALLMQPARESEAQEKAALPAGPAAPAAVEVTEEVSILEAPAARIQDEAAEEKSIESDLPPVVTWNNPVNSVEGYGMGGASTPLESAKDMGGWGSGGGGSSVIPNLVEPLPGGGIVVPLEGVNSIESTQTAADSVAMVPAQESASDQGGGPILGLPLVEQEGEITNQSAWGAPAGADVVPTAEFHPEGDLNQVLSNSRRTSVLTIQLLLTLIAIASGAGAYFLQKRK